jgi:hypothetical protein
MMSDEFPETDLDMPAEKDLDEAFGSRFLGVVDIGDKKIRTKILQVKKDDVKDRESGKLKKKILLFFENIDKALILNAVNRDTLVHAFGKNPAGWKNATVGIFVDPNVTFGGQRKGGVRLRALLPPAAAKPAPAPAAKPTAAPANEWVEKDDPGVDLGQADFEPVN